MANLSRIRGTTIAAMGSDEQNAATTASATLTWTISESGIVKYLYMAHEGTPLVLSDFKHNNDSLITGFMPVSAFGYESMVNPYWGLGFIVSDSVTATVYNPTGGTLGCQGAFSAADFDVNAHIRAMRQSHDAGKHYRLDPQGRRLNRSLIGIGGPTPPTVGAATTATLTFTISEGGILDRLVLMQDQDWDDLTVTSIKLNNDELLTGNVPAQLFRAENPYSPRFGHAVDTTTKLSIVVSNAHAMSTPIVASGFTVL